MTALRVPRGLAWLALFLVATSGAATPALVPRPEASTVSARSEALPEGEILRGARAEAVAPSAYVGRLRFLNVPKDAQVKVDFLPLSAAELREPYTLSVGTHLVEVSVPGRAPLVREVTIVLNQELAFDASLPEEEAVVVETPDVVVGAVPWWPATISATVAALSGTVAIVAGIDWLTTAWSVEQANAALHPETAGSVDPHRHAALLVPREARATNLPLLRAAVRTDMVITTVAGSIALVAAAASGAYLVRWATADESLEEAP